MAFIQSDMGLTQYTRGGATFQFFVYANTAQDSTAVVSAANYFLNVPFPDVPNGNTTPALVSPGPHGAIISTGSMIYDQFNKTLYIASVTPNTGLEPTGVTVAAIASPPVGGAGTGTYTPTLFNTINVSSSSSPSPLKYNVNGNQVQVFGELFFTPTASSSTTVLGISLPIPTTSSISGDLAGSGAITVSGTGVAFTLDTANKRALAQYISTGGTIVTLKVDFSYLVV